MSQNIQSNQIYNVYPKHVLSCFLTTKMTFLWAFLLTVSTKLHKKNGEMSWASIINPILRSNGGLNKSQLNQPLRYIKLLPCDWWLLLQRIETHCELNRENASFPTSDIAPLLHIKGLVFKPKKKLPMIGDVLPGALAHRDHRDYYMFSKGGFQTKPSFMRT